MSFVSGPRGHESIQLIKNSSVFAEKNPLPPHQDTLSSSSCESCLGYIWSACRKVLDFIASLFSCFGSKSSEPHPSWKDVEIMHSSGGMVLLKSLPFSTAFKEIAIFGYLDGMAAVWFQEDGCFHDVFEKMKKAKEKALCILIVLSDNANHYADRGFLNKCSDQQPQFEEYLQNGGKYIALTKEEGLRLQLGVCSTRLKYAFETGDTSKWFDTPVKFA